MAFAITAGALLAAGVFAELWSAWVLGWRRLVVPTALPRDPDLPALVLAGPFMRVRQPQGLGLLLLLAGAAVAVRTVGGAVVAGLGAAAVVAIARRADRVLARRYGEAHARYRRAVPLFVPRLRSA